MATDDGERPLGIKYSSRMGPSLLHQGGQDVCKDAVDHKCSKMTIIYNSFLHSMDSISCVHFLYTAAGSGRFYCHLKMGSSLVCSR